MRNLLKFAIAASAAMTFASPSSAAVTICLGGGCAGSNPTSNVLFKKNTTGTSINATLNKSPGIVTFASSESLSTQASGQASIFASDGVLNNPITISYLDGLISKLELNIDSSSSGNVTFSFFGGDSDGLVLGAYALNSNGGNFFNAFNGTFKSVTLSFGNGAMVQNISQVRVTAAGAVPEPATWGLMLMGFAGVGFAMRRRKDAAPKVHFA